MVITMRSGNRWLGLLGAAVVWSSASVLAYSSSIGCIEKYYADGDCDRTNNNAECGYDSGDCCACTCEDTESFSCGENGLACIDPSAPCVDDDDVTAELVENCDHGPGIRNGYCDRSNNNEECGYDGGDCCSCTCQSERDDDDSCTEFACIDPSAPCVDDDDVTAELVKNCGSVQRRGDGYCDLNNNNEGCGYDGGDCCACTCVATTDDDDDKSDDDWSDDYLYGCGGGFACIDPEASCVGDDDINVEIVANCYSLSVGNGYCDQENNVPECNYDGGDCCSCTCEDRPNQKCGQESGFACLDPDAACVEDDDITSGMLDHCDWLEEVGNGVCNQEKNKPECNYDGGDCCECTCDPSNYPWDDEYVCGRYGGFACIDPSAPCVDDDNVTPEMIDINICFAGDIGDGYCDDYNNKEECAYDGGDCCDCTCEPLAGDGCWYGFACIDPEAACVNDDDITSDKVENCGSAATIGDGNCDEDNNKEECGYDGGDCCECTCEVSGITDGYSDDIWDPRWRGCTTFACIDPNADCVADDDITVDMLDNCEYPLGIGDGYCDSSSNNEACNFDGGDCCPCTCENQWDDDWLCSEESGFDCKDPTASCYGEETTQSTDDNDDEESMSYYFVPWEQEGPLPTVTGAIEIGTKTEVGVSATGYDARPGSHVGQFGCGEEGGEGCAPALSRDGISSDVESRWSCASNLVDGDGPCQVEFTFGEPQDIMDILVAFWKGNERIRTLDVHLDGVRTHTHESYTGSTFNTLGVQATGVSKVTLGSVALLPEEWISLIEVLIFVTP